MKTVQLTALVVLCTIFSGAAQQKKTKDSLDLDQKINYLDEVVLLDSRIPLKRSQSGKPVLRINQKQIKQFNGRSL